MRSGRYTVKHGSHTFVEILDSPACVATKAVCFTFESHSGYQSQARKSAKTSVHGGDRANCALLVEYHMQRLGYIRSQSDLSVFPKLFLVVCRTRPRLLARRCVGDGALCALSFEYIRSRFYVFDAGLPHFGLLLSQTLLHLAGLLSCFTYKSDLVCSGTIMLVSSTGHP